MGRLRDGFDAPLWRSVFEESIDLFGNEDGCLHRLDNDANCDIQDPVWSEPTANPIYAAYKIPFLIQDYNQPFEVTDEGGEGFTLATFYLSRAHLDKAGVPRDSAGEYVRVGDILEIWKCGYRLFFDVISIDQMGFVNDSDHWTGYTIEAKRTTKFVPEKNL